jgi:uncharacterized protein YgbK (DUF1537 family)
MADEAALSALQDICGVDRLVAQQLLRHANGDLTTAINTFLEAPQPPAPVPQQDKAQEELLKALSSDPLQILMAQALHNRDVQQAQMAIAQGTVLVAQTPSRTHSPARRIRSEHRHLCVRHTSGNVQHHSHTLRCAAGYAAG